MLQEQAVREVAPGELPEEGFRAVGVRRSLRRSVRGMPDGPRRDLAEVQMR